MFLSNFELLMWICDTYKIWLSCNSVNVWDYKYFSLYCGHKYRYSFDHVHQYLYFRYCHTVQYRHIEYYPLQKHKCIRISLISLTIVGIILLLELNMSSNSSYIFTSPLNLFSQWKAGSSWTFLRATLNLEHDFLVYIIVPVTVKLVQRLSLRQCNPLESLNCANW